MNFKKINKQLHKIKNLVDNISEDAQVSTIEQHLLQSYIRDLYEYTLSKGTVNKVDTSIQVHNEPAPTIEPKQKVKQKTIKKASEVISENKTPTKPTEIEEEIIEAPTQKAVQANAELQELFSESKMSELSDRLSMLPIKDLKRAMGINEKIFTIKELFGGDQHAFDHVMGHLNTLPGFNEAKAFLSNEVALKYNWISEDKMRKAQKLITLIKRRYL